jgi:hypothetical protein
MVDCVIWVGRPGEGPGGVQDVEEGPLVDELERWADTSDEHIVDRMSLALDMPAEMLAVHRHRGLLILGVGMWNI